ncbi:MAG: endonuclease/exonuclease/phosphatase family protein [Candidatus Wildermuthbacteria bacterium]|nr:endonuclease/exonuclease/phosphatase family protein [Candidatus Wildermuthbacteria bacterium]
MTRKKSRTLTLLYLNIAGGQWFEELEAYLQPLAERIDVFCFQEVLDTLTDKQWNSEQGGRFHRQRVDLFKQLQIILPKHQPFFAWYSRLTTVDFPLYLGNAIFVNTERAIRSVAETGDRMVYGKRDSMKGFDLETIPRNVQYVVLELRGGKRLTVFNWHGLWETIGKADTPRRVEQFRVLERFVRGFPGPKILGGDGNTFPESMSSSILAQAGWESLVLTHAIKSTRSSAYTRGDQNGYHADDIFVRGVNELRFELPEVVVSDHLPLVLQCTV